MAEVEVAARAGNADQISADGSSALVTFELRGDRRPDGRARRRGRGRGRRGPGAHPELRVEEFGDASLEQGASASLDEDFQRAENLSLPITLLILVVAFGALVAAGVPLLLGLTAVMATLGLLAPVSQLFPVDEMISSVILLVGLAVGVDYSLFYLRRERAERHRGTPTSRPWRSPPRPPAGPCSSPG